MFSQRSLSPWHHELAVSVKEFSAHLVLGCQCSLLALYTQGQRRASRISQFLILFQLSFATVENANVGYFHMSVVLAVKSLSGIGCTNSSSSVDLA